MSKAGKKPFPSPQDVRLFGSPLLGSELVSTSAIARTEDESEVAPEIGHSQSTERAIAARSVTVIALRNQANPPSDTHALWPRLGRLGTG